MIKLVLLLPVVFYWLPLPEVFEFQPYYSPQPIPTIIEIPQNMLPRDIKIGAFADTHLKIDYNAYSSHNDCTHDPYEFHQAEANTPPSLSSSSSETLNIKDRI